MRIEVPDLQAIADRIVAQAKPGEEIEAYVGRGGETSVRVYEGEVEHFVSAQSAGVGVRVIKDGRTGTAYAGTLDEAAIAEVLAEARDNVQFGNPDEFAGLATSTDVGLDLLPARGLRHHTVGDGLKFGNLVAHAAVPPMVIDFTRKVGCPSPTGTP